MNPIGINYAYWSPTWDAEPLPLVSKTQLCGFDILEINAQKILRMSNKERDALRAEGGKAGLFFTYIGGVTPDTDLTSEDAGIRRKGVKFLEEQARAVRSMGGSLLGGLF